MMTFTRTRVLCSFAPWALSSAIAAAVPGCSGSTASSGSGDAPIPAKYQAFASAFDQERQQLGVPGASVALIEHDEVTFAHGFGTKGPNSQEPVGAKTLFRIGSMTKALTATALLGLVQSGAVSLDATLTSLVPDVAISDAIDLSTLTVRQLLSHQSGLYDYLVVSGPTDDAALSQFLTSHDYAANEYFMDPPGTFYNYSNPDYYLAGLVLERAGGVPYRQAVAERVLSPLGMSRTFFLPAEVIADGDFSNGKSTASDGSLWDVRPDSYDNSWARPAGFAFSSVVDYAKFVQFLAAGNGTVLADPQREAMQSPQVNMLDPGGVEADIQSYGFGLVVDREFQVGNSAYVTKLVWHDGAIPGFTSFFCFLPSTGSGIVWFANADDVEFTTSIVLALQSFAGLTNPTTTPPPGVAVDTSLFPSYAGTYDDTNGIGLVTVTASAGTLSIDIPSFDAVNTPYDQVLRPTSMDNFVVTVQGSQIPLTFIADSTGNYMWIRTRIAVGKRVSNAGGATP
jgi:CubicO group peptidase (beta-lactamase class C family)